MPAPSIDQGNILREVLIDLSEGDFEDIIGFFIRSTAGGVIKYLPMNNIEAEDEFIIKTLPASEKFDDPVLVKKVYAYGGQSMLEDIYVGYGV